LINNSDFKYNTARYLLLVILIFKYIEIYISNFYGQKEIIVLNNCNYIINNRRKMALDVAFDAVIDITFIPKK